MRLAPLSSPSKHLPFPDFVETQERRLSSAAVVVENTDGEVLVLKASYLPQWTLPGGIVDAGESPCEAAVRELQEETGLTLPADTVRFSALIHRQVSGVDIYDFVFQLSEPLSGRIEVKIDNREIIAADWVSKQNINTDKSGLYSSAVKNWASDNPQPYIDYQA